MQATMQLNLSARVQARVTRGASPSLPLQRLRRSTVVRAEGDDKPVKGSEINATDDVKIDRSKVQNIEPGNISNEAAEMRADIGKDRPPTFTEAQAFDGPAPETINGRAAMLGVTSALAAEFATGVGVKQQVLEAPFSILASFIVIALASYIPIARGYTRKEPFANAVFSPKAENWNGRTAMVGWTALLVTEALFGKSTVAFWGLPHGGL